LSCGTNPRQKNMSVDRRSSSCSRPWKTQRCTQLPELGDIFVKLFNHAGSSFDRVDVVFDRKYLSVHEIIQHLSFTDSECETLIHFHALTGCDTESFFADHSKKTAWKLFATYNKLIQGLCKEDLSDNTRTHPEKCACVCACRTRQMKQPAVIPLAYRCF